MIKLRLVKHMEENDAGISVNQFGFCKGLSCLTAIGKAKNFIKEGRKHDYHTFLVSLDISNAFNCLPGDAIIRALKNKNVPETLIKVVKDYLSGRSLTWISSTTKCIRRSVSRGVPQGSILGPLLWNICYDGILNAEIPEGAQIIGYADDTLLMTSQRGINNTISTMQITYGIISDRLTRMGLTLAEDKTEAIWAAKKGTCMDGLRVQLSERSSVVIKGGMKYLGVFLDSSLKFKEHVKIRAEKTRKMINGLSGILKNVKGPRENKRRLYVNAVQSSLLYGCPHWYEGYIIDPKMLNPYEKLNRLLALRVISAYKTVSKVAAEILARMPPIELLAEAHALTYWEVFRTRDVTKEMRKQMLESKKKNMRIKWKEYLGCSTLSGRRVTEAILPVFDQWLDRKFGQLDYYSTQMITGHGSFRDYLFRFNLVDDEICLHCRRKVDSAQHTIQECPEWRQERRSLRLEVSRNLSLKSLIKGMLKSPEAWSAFQIFSEKVIKKKEEFVRNLIIAGEINK